MGKFLTALATLMVLATTPSTVAHPEPATVPYRWQLDFEPGELRLYVDPVDRRPYWFFTYTVMNRTGEDQVWAPSIVLFTDEGRILPSGEGVPSRVERQVRDLLGNPLLEVQDEAIGDLYQGLEHAIEGLAVWPAHEARSNEIALFVGGLSGETARIRNPLTREELILRKTLQRDYLVRGDALARGTRPVEFIGHRWVMR